jgi:hypothetical protein
MIVKSNALRKEIIKDLVSWKKIFENRSLSEQLY